MFLSTSSPFSTSHNTKHTPHIGIIYRYNTLYKHNTNKLLTSAFCCAIIQLLLVKSKGDKMKTSTKLLILLYIIGAILYFIWRQLVIFNIN